jgi:putative MFS transporter
MYNEIKEKKVTRGNFGMFFTNKNRFRKYLCSILIGLPTWYVIGILIVFSNEFGRRFGIKEEIQPGKATMVAYIAIAFADVFVGFVSQWLRSRKKALYIFYFLTAVSIGLYFSPLNNSAAAMYIIAAALGFGTGFWAIFVTMAAEQFGTNLRATAATTVPNMVRGSLPLMLLLFNGLQHYTDYVMAGLITGIIIMLISFVAVYFTEETFGKDLNYIEN